MDFRCLLKRRVTRTVLFQGKENDPGKDSVAEKLYNELPETSFTRSISNPEAVMRRRRQLKLEKKLQQFRSKDGGPDSGTKRFLLHESVVLQFQ